MKRCAFLFPGQGAQYPGMGRDFFDTFSAARRTFEESDDLLKHSFSKCIFEGPSAELTLTKNSQIAIFITNIAILRTVMEQFPSLSPFVCAGLSLGEYAALVAAEKIPFAECLELVRARAEAMHEACMLQEGTMHVVLGLSEEIVAETLAHLQRPLWVANLNCPEQVVIAGLQDAMPLAICALKDKGAKRVLPLDVSGAFHSALMRPAQELLAPKIAAVPIRTSSIFIAMNVPGDFVHDVNDIRRYLFEQVVSPVRWEKSMRSMMAQSVEMYIEMGPGNSLSGMNKRIGAHPTVSVGKISDLELLSKHMEANHATIEC